jgi:UPF0755 protein
MIRKRNFNLFALLLTIVVGLGSYILLWIALTPGPLKKNKIVIINKASLFNVANQLKKQSAINNKISFVLLAKLANSLTNLKAGEYELQEGNSIWNIIRIMQSGNFLKRSITIPEGYSTTQTLELIEQNPYLLGSITKEKYKEGELLPETYFFIHGEKKEDLLNRMSSSMQTTLDKIWKNRNKNIPLKNKSELLILASIVEKEAKIKNEQPIIASVFMNRIKKRMKLESDPTTIYSITKGNYNLERPLRYKDLKIQSPFNTYFTLGLPPTPIANPGLHSIKATANPAETKYIFFVVKDCEGHHSFSSKIKKHTAYVRKYRKLNCS